MYIINCNRSHTDTNVFYFTVKLGVYEYRENNNPESYIHTGEKKNYKVLANILCESIRTQSAEFV